MKRITTFICFILVFLFVLTPQAKAEITNVRWGIHTGGIRLVIDMNRPASYSFTQNANQITLTIADGLYRPFTGQLPSPARSFSVQGTAGETKATVFLLERNLSVNHYILKNPDRIVVDIRKIDYTPPKQPIAEVAEAEKKAVSITDEAVDKDSIVANHVLQHHTGIALPPGESLNTVLAVEDIPMHIIFSGTTLYFNLPANWKALEGSYLELITSHSEILDTDISSLTVTLNGRRTTTLRMKDINQWKGISKIPLDPDSMVEGVNSLTIDAMLHSNQDRCSNVNNPGNWLRIHRESLVHLKYVPSVELALNQFPAPFFEPENYQTDNTLIVLPDAPSSLEIQAAVDLISSFTHNVPFKDFYPLIVTMSDVTRDIAMKHHILYLGNEDRFTQELLNTFGSTQKLEKGNVFASVFLNKEAFGRMLITAGNGEDLCFAVQALLTPETRKQMLASASVIPTSLPLPKTIDVPRDVADVSLVDIGRSDVVFRGILQHQETVNYQIPPNWKIKGNPILVLMFRHAPNLEGKKSALEVDVNNVPMKGVALTPENANDGRLSVPIPAERLNNGFISFQLKSYLDIDIPDCTKRFMESAWLTIDRNSYLHIPHDIVPLTARLSNMPYLLDGKRELTIYTEKEPTGKELSALSVILSAWQRTLPWKVVFHIKSFDEWTAGNNEENQLLLVSVATLHEKGVPLPVGYDPEKEEILSGEKIPVLPAFANQSALLSLTKQNGGIQIISTWNHRMPTTVSFRQALLDWNIDGDVAFISPIGDAIPFFTSITEEKIEEKPTLSFWQKVLLLFSSDRNYLGIFTLVAVAIMSILLITLFARIRRK